MLFLRSAHGGAVRRGGAVRQLRRRRGLGRDVPGAGRAAGRVRRSAGRAAGPSAAPSCASAPSSWPGSSPTAASRSRTPARSGRSRSTSCRGSSPPRSGTTSSSGRERSGCARWRRSSPTSTAPARCFTDGVVPRGVIVTSAHFHREAVGIEPANGVRVHVAGVDLIRDEQGTFRVLEDNVRVPSGVSYVIENRRAMTQCCPGCSPPTGSSRSTSYPAMLLARAAGRGAAGVGDPTVVVLTPGVYNSAYFEHALLARQMGVELVEGRDLVCVGNQVRDAHDRGRAPGRRHLPADRRRLPRPGALPRRLGDRLRRAAQRRPRRPGHDRQRGRQRRRRRQARSTRTCPT